MKTPSNRILALSAALLGLACQTLTAGPSEEDILIYRFSRAQSWQQNNIESNPITGDIEARRQLRGIYRENSYWILATDSGRMAEIRYYLAPGFGGTVQKRFQVIQYDYWKLNQNVGSFSTCGGFMEQLSTDSAKTGRSNQSFRASMESSYADYGWGYRNFGCSWDLTGTGLPLVIAPGLQIPDVARSLRGFYQGNDTEQQNDDYSFGENTQLRYFRNRSSTGGQRAKLDAGLTKQANTLSLGVSPRTLQNGILAVMQKLVKSGYEIDDSAGIK